MKQNLLIRMAVFVAAMMMCLGSSAIDKVIKKSEMTGEITSVEDLASATFMLQNGEGDEAVVLYTPSGWDIKVAPLATAAAKNDNGGFYKLEAIGDHYLIPVFNIDQSVRTFWSGAQQYVNSQPVSMGTVIFGLSGAAPQYGQDAQDHALWDITYEEGQGFVFHCVGRDIYIGHNGTAAFASSDVFYWKAYTGYILGYDETEVLAAYDVVEAAVKTTDTSTTLSNAKAAYDEGGTLDAFGDAVNAAIDAVNECEAVNAAYANLEGEAATIAADVLDQYNNGEFANVAELRAAYIVAIKAQTTPGSDFTGAIINPSFETGNIEGWTSYNGGMVANNGNFGAATGSFFIEKWTGSANTLSDGAFLQTITGLPNGVYKLTAELQNREQGNGDAAGTGFFLVANGNMTEAVTSRGETIAVESFVTDGTLEIGTMIEDCSGNWICFDNFQLTYLRALANDEDMTAYIVNAGFDEDLTWYADGSKKDEAVRMTELSSRSIAYVTEDGSLYATVNPNTSWTRPDDRTFDATNGFIGQIDGWNAEKLENDNCEWVYFGTLPYDLEYNAIPISDNGSSYAIVPERPTEFDGGNGALSLRAGWGGSFSYKQEVTVPCAKYRLEYWTINVNPNTTSSATDLSKITCMRDVFQEEGGSALTAMEWTKHEFEFTPLTTFTLEFGMQVSNSGSATTPWVFIDGIKLYKIGEADPQAIAANELYYYDDLLASYIEDYSDYAALVEEMIALQGEVEAAIASEDLDTMNSTIAKVEEKIKVWDVQIAEYYHSKDIIEKFGIDGKTLVKNEPVYLYNVKAQQLITSGPSSSRPDGILAVFCEDRMPLCFELVDTVQYAANGATYEGIAIKSYNNPYPVDGLSIAATQLGIQVNTKNVFIRYNNSANLLIPVFSINESEAGYFNITSADAGVGAYMGYNSNLYSFYYNSTAINCNLGYQYDGATDWAIIPARNAAAYIETIKVKIARADLQKVLDDFDVEEYFDELMEELIYAWDVLDNDEATSEELVEAKKNLLIAINHAKFSTIRATEMSPVEVTDIVFENAAFNEGTTRGWVIDGIESTYNMGYQGAYYYNEDSYINDFIEVWQPASVGGLTDGRICQTVYGLPAGKYILRADALIGQTENEYVDGVSLFMQDFYSAITRADGQPHSYSFAFEYDGSDETTFGVDLMGTTANWIAADNFRLYYLGNGETPEILLGDSNCDGTVDVVDVTTVVDFILERQYPNEVQWNNSDVNYDGSIDVVDLTSIVQIILGTYDNASGAYGAKSRTVTSDALTVEDSSISLENSRDYVGFQMDVTVSDDAQFRGVQLSDRSEDHSVTYSRIAENTYRIVSYSVSGTPFSGNTGTLLNVKLSGGSVKSISNAVFSNGSRGFAIEGGDGTTNLDEIVNGESAAGEYYDLSGRRVTTVKKGGIYLKKGGKVLAQ